MPRAAAIDLSPADWASLALLAERPAHGFAVARALAPDGEVGRVWSRSRPLVYRALERLDELSLIEERGSEPSDAGPRRTVLGATRSGRRELERWLAEPAAHVRELRSSLMLKLLFLSRRGADASELLGRQRSVLAGLVGGARGSGGRGRGLRSRSLRLAARVRPCRAALCGRHAQLSGTRRVAVALNVACTSSPRSNAELLGRVRRQLGGQRADADPYAVADGHDRRHRPRYVVERGAGDRRAGQRHVPGVDDDPDGAVDLVRRRELGAVLQANDREAARTERASPRRRLPPVKLATKGSAVRRSARPGCRSEGAGPRRGRRCARRALPHPRSRG